MHWLNPQLWMWLSRKAQHHCNGDRSPPALRNPGPGGIADFYRPRCPFLQTLLQSHKMTSLSTAQQSRVLSQKLGRKKKKNKKRGKKKKRTGNFLSLLPILPSVFPSPGSSMKPRISSRPGQGPCADSLLHPPMEYPHLLVSAQITAPARGRHLLPAFSPLAVHTVAFLPSPDLCLEFWNIKCLIPGQH